MPFYQMISIEDEGLIATGLEAVTDEEARLIPWFFLFDENQEALDGQIEWPEKD